MANCNQTLWPEWNFSNLKIYELQLDWVEPIPNCRLGTSRDLFTALFMATRDVQNLNFRIRVYTLISAKLAVGSSIKRFGFIVDAAYNL